MKNMTKRKFISFFLAMTMLFLALPLSPIGSFAETEEEGSNNSQNTNYGAAIGAIAEFKNTSNVILDVKPVSTEGKSVSVDLLPALVVIQNYHYDEVNGKLWYQIDSAPGEKDWPADYADYHWAYADDLNIVSQNGMTGVFDADGNAVTELTLPKYKKIELTAESSLQGSVSYQWQICYDVKNDEWVDIYGEDSATVKLTYGMVASLLDSNNTVKVRCESVSGSKSNTSTPIVVTLDESDDGSDPVEPTEPTIEIQKDGYSVTQLKILDSDTSYSVDLSVVTNLTGNVTYTWAMVNSKGTHTLTDLTTDAITLKKISHINSYLEEIDDSSVFTSTLQVTATDGVSTVSAQVAIYVYENAVSDYFKTADGEYIDFVIIGDGVADTTLDLTETESSVTLPEGEDVLLALDITLRDADGNEWQPVVGESVTITLIAAQLGLEDGDYFVVYHVHEGETQKLGPYLVKNGYVTFEVIGFSEFVFVSDDPAEDIGKNALIVTESVQLAKDPSVTASPNVKPVSPSLLPEVVQIVGYYYDEVNAQLWYKVTAPTWPEEYAEYTYLRAYAVEIGDYELDYGTGDGDDDTDPEPPADAAIKIQVNGEDATSADFYFVYGYELPLTAVVTGVESPVFKWEICTSATNDQWSTLDSTTAEYTVEYFDCLGKWQEATYTIVRVSVVGTELSATIRLNRQDELPEEPAEPSVSVTVNGEEVTEITVSTAKKVTLTATPNVEGTTTYKWQILIPSVNMWVAISGQTSADCTVNYGMVANRLDSDGKAHVRCVTTVNGETITGEAIAVNIASTRTRYSQSGASRASSGDTTSKYTVTVYYYVGDSTVMHREVYTMEFGVTEEPKTTSFPIPEREGYTAYYFGTNANTGIKNGEEYTEAEYVLANFKPTSDMSLYVRYYPNDDTPYRVEHYIQNVYDDNYTLLDTDDLFGTTDSYIPAYSADYVDTLAWNLEDRGFYAIPYKRDTIAANGNTVVKIYYDRYMYLLLFNLGEGGTGVEPIYARVGVEYPVDNEPTRRGYTFQGWTLEDGTTIDKDSKPYVFTIPAKDSMVTAIWNEATTTYTVVYWKENADPDKDANGNVITDDNGNPVYSYSYWTHVVEDADTGMIVSGTDNVEETDAEDTNYFTFNEVATDKDVVVKGNGSTVVNVYYLRNYYEIYFYARGNENPLTSCAVTEHSHTDGTCEKYLICAQPAHVHDDSCTQLGLSCGTDLHTHTDACCTKTVHAAHTSECCTLSTAHTHTTDCYDNVNTWQNPNNSDLQGAPSNPVDGQIYRRGYSYNLIIYINGTWYRYTEDDGSGTIVQPNEDCPGVHTHGDGNCVYADALHTHGDGTCTCAQVEHIAHTDACYDWECGATVSHEHTDACYSACTKPVHAHGNDCYTGNNSSSRQYLLKIIRAKYDSDISKEWPVANDSIPGLAGFGYWTGNSNASYQSSRVVTMNDDWCNSNGISVNANYSSNRYQLNYWFEDWDQTNTTTSSTRVYNQSQGKYYVLSDKYTQTAYYGNASSWSYKTITGMIATANSASISNGTANLYYNRSKYTLTFESDNKTVTEETNVPFEKPLSYYLDANGNYINSIIPTENPIDKPANGYYFEGWYTTSECFPGTKVDFTKLTMPNNDLTLFANWAPRTHTIEFFFDETLSTRLDETQFPNQLILHNEYGADPGLPGHPLDFQAITWFYKDANGEEQTFNFDMPVTTSMQLYPKWRTNVYIKYEVRYKVYDRLTNTYTDTEIADRFYGEELYGELVTLYPKGTEEFYDAYKQAGNGYFPMSGSHSISMGEQSCTSNPPYTYCVWDEETSTHIFTFYYVNGPTVPYTVEYHEVDENGNFVKKLIADKYVSDNYYAKVVENAAFIVGYMPDEAQKSLTVVWGGENKIIFEYTKDESASFYRVSHWIKKYGSNEYVLIQPYDDFASHVGDIISNYPPLNIPGVNHTHTVIDPSNYTVGTSVDGEPGLTVDLYYEEESVTINYVVVGPNGCGTLTLYTETVGAYYGTVTGSQATASPNVYKFVGWYSDPACSIPVTYDTTNNKYVPSKVDGLHVAATYYAKFEYNLTSLTIQKEGWQTVDPNQTFIFNITGNGLKLDVTVHGNGSTTIDGLTVGQTYTITEKTDWSWRYEYESVALTNATLVEEVTNGATITLGLDGTITFTNTREETKWLDGDSWLDNLFEQFTNANS